MGKETYDHQNQSIGKGLEDVASVIPETIDIEVSIASDTPVAGWFIVENPARMGCLWGSTILGHLHM